MFSAIVVGGGGLLGTALSVELLRLKEYYPQYELTITRRNSMLVSYHFLDLTVPHPKLPYIWPGGVVFLVAAITSLGAAEIDPAAWRVNADAPAALALEAAKGGMFPIFISSDAVERFPHMAYAKQKAYAETIVLSCGGAVVRPTRIPRENVGDLVQTLISVANNRNAGLHRWSA